MKKDADKFNKFLQDEIKGAKVEKTKEDKNKTMKLPINGHEYTIRFISGAKVDLGSDESEILGAISMRNCEIVLEHEMKDIKLLNC